nr:MAG TPA: hypothetical protein [Caudoviricetes sp.]
MTQFLTQFIFLDATKGFACIASYLHKNNLLSFNPLHNLRVPVEFPLFDSHCPLHQKPPRFVRIWAVFLFHCPTFYLTSFSFT